MCEIKRFRENFSLPDGKWPQFFLVNFRFLRFFLTEKLFKFPIHNSVPPLHPHPSRLAPSLRAKEFGGYVLLVNQLCLDKVVGYYSPPSSQKYCKCKGALSVRESGAQYPWNISHWILLYGHQGDMPKCPYYPGVRISRLSQKTSRTVGHMFY